MEPGRKLVENGNLKEDREAFIQYLLNMGYSQKSLRNYKWITKCIDQFMYESNQTKYSPSIGEAFLVEAATSGRHTAGILKVMKCIVRRFNCFMDHGEYIIKLPLNSRETPPQFADTFANYLGHMKIRGIRESTIEDHRYNIHKALHKLDAAGIQDFSEVKPAAIYDIFEKTSYKRGFCSPFRGFLRYLYEEGIIEIDYSVFVPSIRKAHPIPSVYTSAETGELLGCIETNPTCAKRNNAIILIALRLGLRSSDIANLKMTDVDFKNKTISFIQQKTHVPQCLELLPDIEQAVLLYINTARPISDNPGLFLSINPPVRAVSTRSIYSLISNRFKRSCIDTGERALGGHSLRMTLASELVAEKVPYDAVRKILGHEDPSSIKHYVRFDIESLRSCAIEVPHITGKLAAYMESRLGGDSQ
jgi:site-specific recombinase XerD